MQQQDLPMIITPKKGKMNVLSVFFPRDEKPELTLKEVIMYCENEADGLTSIIERVRKGENIHTKDDDRHSLLHHAALQDRPIILRYLLDNGLEINARSTIGSTPLMFAVLYSPECTSELLSRGADMDDAGEGVGPLHVAAVQNSVEAIQLLLQHGARIEKKMKTGITALLLAARSGHSDAFDALLDAGANMEVIDKQGFSIKTYALKGMHPKIIWRVLTHHPKSM